MKITVLTLVFRVQRKRKGLLKLGDPREEGREVKKVKMEELEDFIKEIGKENTDEYKGTKGMLSLGKKGFLIEKRIV